MTDHDPTDRFDSEDAERLADVVAALIGLSRAPADGPRPEVRARLLATVARRVERATCAA